MQTFSDRDSAVEPMHDWMRALFPICRSLTGEGTRTTLAFIKELVPELEIRAVPSGTRAFDWVVPDEWNIRDAYIADLDGRRIVDFKQSNLHVVGYSIPIDAVMSRAELDPHLHSLPEQPDAIPYITSYYQRRWGFCLSEQQRRELGPGPFRVVIDSSLEPGVLNYGEVRLPGSSASEVLLSTYVCHPSMANNELSGPVVAVALARWLKALPSRRLSYRVLFVPETIGALVYLSRHLAELKTSTVAGFVLTCLGDDRAWSLVPSRRGGTLADRVAQHVLKHRIGEYMAYSFLDRGSDERQYCAPGIDLPVVSIMRSKYGTYPEYHTSLDDLSFVTQNALAASFEVLRECLEVLESNAVYRTSTLGEPQLSPRGLYPSLSTHSTRAQVVRMMNILAYADGSLDLLGIAETIGAPAKDVAEIAARLSAAGVLDRIVRD